MRMPTVCLVGRPNVGKSTIFNRLVGKKISIIEDTPGVTRDRIYGDAKYLDYSFHLIDTGGIDVGDDTFNDEIRMQASIAIDEADVIIFVVDGKEDITKNDYVIRDMLRKSGKDVVVAVHNIGFQELLDKVVQDFKPIPEIEYSEDKIKFCFIGRPNVGKSSLVNALLNEEKAIVSNVAGTTRDAVDTEFRYEGKDYVVIDTAGLRKKGKVYESIEKYSVIRSMKAIERSDVCCIVINAEEGIIEHDKHIASYALEAGKPLVLVVNKWDTVNDKNDIKSFTTLMRNEFQFLSYVPIVFVSALTKKRIHTLMPEILKVYKNSTLEIKTSVLNEVIREAVLLNQPPSYKGKRLKIYFANQSGTRPPKFTLHVNSKGLVHFSYERYLENKLRENFDLEGTPIVIQFKNKNEDY